MVALLSLAHVPRITVLLTAKMNKKKKSIPKILCSVKMWRTKAPFFPGSWGHLGGSTRSLVPERKSVRLNSRELSRS